MQQYSLKCIRITVNKQKEKKQRHKNNLRKGRKAEKERTNKWDNQKTNKMVGLHSTISINISNVNYLNTQIKKLRVDEKNKILHTNTARRKPTLSIK